MTNVDSDSGEKSERTGYASWLPALAAAIILAFFGLLLWKMFNLAASIEDDAHWSRLLFLYNGLEALAFAAAGVLLGERVQRTRAIAAENRAENAEEKAEEAQKQATEAKVKGETLKSAIEAKMAPRGAEEAAAVRSPELAELATLANELFPR